MIESVEFLTTDSSINRKGLMKVYLMHPMFALTLFLLPAFVKLERKARRQKEIDFPEVKLLKKMVPLRKSSLWKSCGWRILEVLCLICAQISPILEWKSRTIALRKGLLVLFLVMFFLEIGYRNCISRRLL